MVQLLLVLVGALVVAAIAFGVAALITGADPGLVPSEPDGRAVPLPVNRPLVEEDVSAIRFDTALRGYRMAQVDAALRRTAYDVGYKQELIAVLEAEVAALRDGRVDDADVLAQARAAALSGGTAAADQSSFAGADANAATEPALAIGEPEVLAADGAVVEEEVFISGEPIAEPDKALADGPEATVHSDEALADRDEAPQGDEAPQEEIVAAHDGPLANRDQPQANRRRERAEEDAADPEITLPEVAELAEHRRDRAARGPSPVGSGRRLGEHRGPTA
jgi:DivIVA domain-containing protein